MRVEFNNALLQLASNNPKLTFLTGDLGFMAFENLQQVLGDRFLNMGVAEQNMISVAACLAKDGFLPFVYSIAPFVVARPYEQIRNEIGLHNMPVKIVANGGGFGYGIMGSTHHCLEDVALMRTMPNMQLFLPTFLDDVAEAVALMANSNAPNYLRLNSSKNRPANVAAFNGIRQVTTGVRGVIIGYGPAMLAAIEANQNLNLNYSIWLVDSMPIINLPTELIQAINNNKNIVFLEEHYAAGGLGEHLTYYLLKNKLIDAANLNFNYLNVAGYISGNYGSQQWHLEENGLAGPTLINQLKTIAQ
jgi:transketolase